MKERKLLQEIAANTKPLPPSAPTPQKRMERLIGRGTEGANTVIYVPQRETWRVQAVMVTYIVTNAGNFMVEYLFAGSPTNALMLSNDLDAGDIVYLTFFINADANNNNVPSGVPTEALRVPLPDISLMGGDTIILGHQEAGAPGAAVFYYMVIYERSLSE